MVHGYTHMPAQAPPPGGAGPRPDTVKPKVEKPTITAGASNDEWTNFQSDWSTYKSICGLPANQVNKHLLDCCQEDLKHLLYGEYSATELDAAAEANVLATIKSLAVVNESKLSHRLRLGDAVQSPTQTIHAYVAVLKNLA